MLAPSPLSARPSELLLLGRLREAEAGYAAAIRETRAGVTAAALDLDTLRWRTLGTAIVDLARLLRDHCAGSLFCDARPGVEALASRLIEAIDDQIDAPAWRVIDAQARLRAASADA